MNALEQELLREAVGDEKPRLCVRSNTGIDAGRWWRSTPVWLCVMETELVVLAVARRRYIEHAPLAECNGSHYAHATGELVIAPVETLRFNHFRMPPRDALSLLGVIKPQSAARDGRPVETP